MHGGTLEFTVPLRSRHHSLAISQEIPSVCGTHSLGLLLFNSFTLFKNYFYQLLAKGPGVARGKKKHLKKKHLEKKNLEFF